MEQVSGVSGAAPIWRGVMLAAQQSEPPAWERPSGLTQVEVCAESGLLPGPACIHRRTEWYLDENVPTETCTITPVGTWTDSPAGGGRRHATGTAGERTGDLWPPEALAWAGGNRESIRPAIGHEYEDNSMALATDATLKDAVDADNVSIAERLTCPALRPHGPLPSMPRADTSQRLAVQAVAPSGVQWVERVGGGLPWKPLGRATLSLLLAAGGRGNTSLYCGATT